MLSQHSQLGHTSLEGHLGYEKCLQGSVNGFWALLMGYFENQLSPKWWQGAFYENQLFSFLGPPKMEKKRFSQKAPSQYFGDNWFSK